MKVLFVCELESTVNPFVSTLMNGLRNVGVDVDSSVKKFWENPFCYDIVHFHWPECIFDWKANISLDELNAAGKLISKLRESGKKIVITCHNLHPHTSKDGNLLALFDEIYRNCDLFLHMGGYSLNVLEEKYSKGRHVVLPHHIYDSIYSFKTVGDKLPEISRNKINVLCFGQFRNDEERNIVLGLVKSKQMDKVNFVVPGFFKQGLKGRNVKETASNILKMIRYKRMGLKYRKEVVSNCETEQFFVQSDIVLIPRPVILNSGNLPMAFAAGKVVVGPNVGNVGDILKSTGNPVFDPEHFSSIVEAVERGFNLMRTDMGKKNYEFAITNWSTERIALKLNDFYKSLF